MKGYAAPRARALQPKLPFVQVRAELALLQPAPGSPAPKKLVVEAKVAKRLVEVAFVVVLRKRLGRSVSVPIEVVALMRKSDLKSARELVKYKFAPSCTLVVRKPREEVAI